MKNELVTACSSAANIYGSISKINNGYALAGIAIVTVVGGVVACFGIYKYYQYKADNYGYTVVKV